MVTFTQIFVVVPSLSSYRKPVGFLNAFVMWSVDSNGKEFPWNLTCSQNQEGRWERTERSQLLRIRRFPTSGRPNKHSAFDVNINEVFPVEWILDGYIFGNHLVVCCLHYLTQSSLSLCWLWERKKSGNDKNVKKGAEHSAQRLADPLQAGDGKGSLASCLRYEV